MQTPTVGSGPEKFVTAARRRYATARETPLSYIRIAGRRNIRSAGREIDWVGAAIPDKRIVPVNEDQLLRAGVSGINQVFDPALRSRRDAGGLGSSGKPRRNNRS